MADWYEDWQRREHAVLFDWRAGLDARNVVREYDRYNDVRLLSERVDASRPQTLVEVGCATGEFYRYLQLRASRLNYAGLDISEAAIARAKQKYPKGRFVVTQAGEPLGEALARAGITGKPEVVYAKDVVHHQTQPFALLRHLLTHASEASIMRLRTRDAGQTEWDPDHSCQYHYNGWMPYIIINLQELLDEIRRLAPQAEIVGYRHHLILGGRTNRFLPKDCFLPETGTAETAIGVFFRTNQPGNVVVTDRPDEQPAYTWDYIAKCRFRSAFPKSGRAPVEPVQVS